MRRIVAVFALLGVAWILLPLPHTAEATTRHIDINAAEYAYSPGRIRVNQGDHVIITLTSSDVVHGIHLDEYDIEERVTPGVAQHIEFTADQTGKFRFRCPVPCGSLHPFMIGEMVVSPNKPFMKFAGLVLIAVAGMMVYLYRYGANKEFAQ